MMNCVDSGANPNAQTMETEQTKINADERVQARIQAKLEAKNRAVKKIKDMRQQRIQKRAAEVAEKRKRRPQPKPIPPPDLNVPMKPQTATPGIYFVSLYIVHNQLTVSKKQSQK